ncbi:fatty acid-binding protein-like [Pollicipes pollicipes]|uniref:fatty acid-binding protein-like n=1 Tax=Pollicipes pollicipes TaxID=41117 RepID=UPI00188598C2|nr:fatty acid-binding protein-like [Pollicipes pollicipes]
MVTYNGEYKLASSDKFDEVMKAMGVGLITRKAANAATPVITVTTRRHPLELRQVTSFKTHEQEFDIGRRAGDDHARRQEGPRSVGCRLDREDCLTVSGLSVDREDCLTVSGLSVDREDRPHGDAWTNPECAH